MTHPQPTDDYLKAQKHYGNNKHLLAVLQENGINIPADYFDKLDDRGLYDGIELTPEAKG